MPLPPDLPFQDVVFGFLVPISFLLEVNVGIERQRISFLFDPRGLELFSFFLRVLLSVFLASRPMTWPDYSFLVLSFFLFRSFLCPFFSELLQWRGL